MSRLRTVLEWTAILVPFLIIVLLIAWVMGGTGSHQSSGLPDGNGGYYQDPISPPQQFSRNVGDWQFTFPSFYSYTLAGKVVGKHEYPPDMPDGIIPIDLAVVNGDLLNPGILSFFTFTMGYHTLEYHYDIPAYTGLTEAYIDEHISNNHLIFLDPAIESEVMKTEPGSCLVIRGNLVDIRGSSPARLYLANTSTVRNDSYPAGCEIILVTSYTPVNCGSQSGSPTG